MAIKQTVKQLHDGLKTLVVNEDGSHTIRISPSGANCSVNVVPQGSIFDYFLFKMCIDQITD